MMQWGEEQSERKIERRVKRREDWMMNREHGEVIKSPVDAFMATCS